MKDFIFDGEKLSDYGYVVCSVGSAVGLETAAISEMSVTEIKSPLSERSHIAAASYDTNLSSTIQIMKTPCGSEKVSPVTNEDLSALTRWLCRKEYKWFSPIGENAADTVYHQVRFQVRQLLLADRRIGLELDIISNAPFGYTEKKEVLLSYHENGNSLTLDSDEEGYIYPDAVITINEDGNLLITNAYENRITRINNCKSGEVLTFTGGDTLQLVSSREGHDLSADFNYNFIRLCSRYKDSVNTFTTSIDCHIRLKYREIRKAGLS
ncbi:MAG: phage tail domain-containing protein [Lachnospiraceae bacterium]